MTLNEIYTMLNGIEGMENKVAFDEIPTTQNQTLPYINLQSPTTSTFGADNIVYYQSPNVDIELYTKRKDISLEAKIENTLTSNAILVVGYIFYSKYEGRIDEQSCYQVVYSIGA